MNDYHYQIIINDPRYRDAPPIPVTRGELGGTIRDLMTEFDLPRRKITVKQTRTRKEAE